MARAGEPLDAGDAKHADPGVGMEDGFGTLCEQQHCGLAQDDRGARAIRQPAPNEVVRSGRIASTACGYRMRQELRIELCKPHGCPTSLRGQRQSLVLDRVDLLLRELRGRVDDPVREAIAVDHDRARRALDLNTRSSSPSSMTR
jgi:hypothetical protein